MRHDYGFIDGTTGADGEEVDCYLGPNESAPNAYVVEQLKRPRYDAFDEHKVFLGFDSEATARAAYAAHRDDGVRAIGAIKALPLAEFKQRLREFSKKTEAQLKTNQSSGAIAFSVADFRFSVGDIAGAIGKWSRGATMGYKARADLEFNVQSLGALIDHVAKRGDKVSICQDHLSVLGPPKGRPAPSLGYFYALALFDKGQLVKHWTFDGGAAPESIDEQGTPRDGLYCRLGEITPLGADPLQGLANYASLSPTFETNATDEDGSTVPVFLIDFAATSAPYQGGCPIQFHRTGVQSMAIQIGDQWKVNGEIWTVKSIEGGRAKIHDTTSGRDLDYGVDEFEQVIRNTPSAQKLSALQVMASASDFKPGDRVRYTGGATREIGTVDDPRYWHGATIPPGYVLVKFPDNIKPVDPQYLTMYSALGAAGAFNQGARMDPSMMKRFGFAEGAVPTVDEKMAKFAQHFASGAATPEDVKSMADHLAAAHPDHEGAQKMAQHFAGYAAKMAEPDKKPDGDEPTVGDVEKFDQTLPRGTKAGEAQNAAIHLKTGQEHNGMSRMSAAERQSMLSLVASLRARGVNVPSTATRATLMAMAVMGAPAAPQVDVAALVKAEMDKQRAADAKAEADLEAAEIVEMARAAKAPEHEITALSIVAKSDIVTARAMAQKYAATGAPPHLFARSSRMGGPIGAPGGSGARDMPGPKGPRVIGKSGDAIVTLIMDDESGDAIEKMADSKDPIIMSKVDARLAPNERTQKWARLVAAGKVLKEERPALFEEESQRAIMMSR